MRNFGGSMSSRFPEKGGAWPAVTEQHQTAWDPLQAGATRNSGDSVSLQLRLALDFVTFAGAPGSSVRAAFEQALARDLSYAAVVPPDVFRIKAIAPGSVVVELEIRADSSGQVAARPADVAAELQRQSADTRSRLRSGSLTRYIAGLAVAVRAGEATSSSGVLRGTAGTGVSLSREGEVKASRGRAGGEQGRDSAWGQPFNNFNQDSGSRSGVTQERSNIAHLGGGGGGSRAPATLSTPSGTRAPNVPGDTWDRMSGAGMVAPKELPEGWVEQFSRTKLQPYYLHVPTGATTWVRPAARASSDSRRTQHSQPPPPPTPPAAAAVAPPSRALVGLGLVLQQSPPVDAGPGAGRGSTVVVERVVPGGGADLSGAVSEGDVIVSVDGVGVSGMQLPQILSLVRGQEGTVCVLGVERRPRSAALPAGTGIREEVPPAFVRCGVLRVATPHTVFREPRELQDPAAANDSVSAKVRNSLRRLNLPEKREMVPGAADPARGR
jgi:hypothetical protein